MAQDDDAQSSGQGSPKRKTLNLDLFFGPVTGVPTTVGAVFARTATDWKVRRSATRTSPQRPT